MTFLRYCPPAGISADVSFNAEATSTAQELHRPEIEEADMQKGLGPYLVLSFALVLVGAYVSAYFAIQTRYRRECAIETAMCEYNSGFINGEYHFVPVTRCEFTVNWREADLIRNAFPMLSLNAFTVIVEARVYQSYSEHKFDYRWLMQCRHLTYVDLQQCEVTDADLEHISQLPHLKRLSLSATTTISDTQSKWLSKQRPDLVVDR
jgi:hypothetical protein